jgi:hypothetical protein
MQKYVMAEAMEHEMKLVQMGGKVTQITSKLCYVKFEIDGIEIEYVYNINSKGQFFLERIKPYPLPVKPYEDESKIIEIIDIDLEQFRQAAKSHNMPKFIKLGQQFHETAKRFEDLFLYYNVPDMTVEEMMTVLAQVNKTIDDCKNNAKRLYFKKEPDNL